MSSKHCSTPSSPPPLNGVRPSTKMNKHTPVAQMSLAYPENPETALDSSSISGAQNARVPCENKRNEGRRQNRVKKMRPQRQSDVHSSDQKGRHEQCGQQLHEPRTCDALKRTSRTLRFFRARARRHTTPRRQAWTADYSRCCYRSYLFTSVDVSLPRSSSRASFASDSGLRSSSSLKWCATPKSAILHRPMPSSRMFCVPHQTAVGRRRWGWDHHHHHRDHHRGVDGK